MKKIALLIIIGVFVSFMLSCGGETKIKQEETHTEEAAITETEDIAITSEFDLEASISAGESIYTGKGLCQTCHQVNGQGVDGTFPPLASADFVLSDKNAVIKTSIYGTKEPVTVNDVEYPGGMMTPATGLIDEEIRDVVNYVLNSWGNEGGSVLTADVTAQR